MMRADGVLVHGAAELVMACEVGEDTLVPGILESLFETGVSVDTLVGDGDSALHTACLYGERWVGALGHSSRGSRGGCG